MSELRKLFGKVYFESEKSLEDVKNDFENLLGSEANEVDDEDSGDFAFTFYVIGGTTVSIHQFTAPEFSKVYIYEFLVGYSSFTMASNYHIYDYLHTFLRNNGYTILLSEKLVDTIKVKEEEYVIESKLLLTDSRPLIEIISQFKEVFNSTNQTYEEEIIARKFGCLIMLKPIENKPDQYLFSVTPAIELKTKPEILNLDAYFLDLLKEEEKLDVRYFAE